MPRKQKQKVELNNYDSLSGILQESYNDACQQVLEAQKYINELSSGATPEDVDDLTKIAKEKGNFLKAKDSAIRIKLEVAKMQSDIIKHGGDAGAAIAERSHGETTVDDFKAVREMLKQRNNTPEENEE